MNTKTITELLENFDKNADWRKIAYQLAKQLDELTKINKELAKSVNN